MEQTKLTVVNALLRVIGESPVNTIDLGHPDIVHALNIWDEYSDEILSNGWWFNVETWQLQPQTDGTVVIPPDVLAVNTPDTNYIKKGRYLYDLENHTNDFTGATETNLNLDLLMSWSVDELPPTMFNYILSACKLKMLMDLAFDGNKAQELQGEVQRRYFLVQKQHLRFAGPNRLSTSSAQALLNVQPQR